MLDVQHLNAYYGEAQALFDVSFSVPTGSMVLIHGLNGAGKSTLMKSIIGLMPKVKGHIAWQGQALMNLPPYQRSEVGLSLIHI
jgi:branched-chain amino acid transport system ATP-binding protein